MQVTMRTINGLEEMNSSAFDIMLFNYLKYLSNMDLGNGARAQSGNFTYTYQGNELFFVFLCFQQSKNKQVYYEF